MPKRRMKRHAVTQPLDESYRLIPLTQGQNAIVDVEDWAFLSKFNWAAKWYPKAKTYYAVRRGGDGKIMKMHRVILGEPEGEVDHKDRNALNNRRNNLRPCTHQQNVCNGKMRSDNTSGFRGIYFDKRKNKWIAETRKNRKHIHIGEFRTPEAAARARDVVVSRMHGEFAVLNFPSS